MICGGYTTKKGVVVLYFDGYLSYLYSWYNIEGDIIGL